MYLLRTKEGHEAYEDHKKKSDFTDGCALCKKRSIKEFEYWKIIKNDFPYDKIADIHNMITSKRHTEEAGLSEEEKEELLDIKKDYMGKNYQFIIEATPNLKSIPEHFHLHLIVTKE